MTSQNRVSDFKLTKQGAVKNADGKPRDGTYLRDRYDALRRGEVVKFPSRHGSALRRQLEDFYGMDIVRGDSPAEYLLVGEWDGPYYVPIERILVTEQ